ncbi:MAG: cupredoxin domain-containing protein [Actinomycetota bacterium]
MRAGLLAVALGVASVVFLTGQASPGPREIHVTIRHSHFSPGNLSLPAGGTVRFVITNEDPIDHEFIVGSPVVQYHMEHTAHPSHDGSVLGQISVPAGTTVETTYTVRRTTQPLLYGCHLPGHYRYGMRGIVTIL